MPREKDSFRDHVEFLPNNKWKCNFCSKEYGGSVTRIKAHLAGVAGYGINDCKDVDDRVRSEARNALKGKGAVEQSSEAEGNVEEGPHLPVTANNEDAWRETSFAAMPYLSSEVMSTVGASSLAFLPLPETNLPSQSLPAQNMIPWGAFPLLPQQPQSHAGDSYTQPRNFSYPSSRPDLAPEALTNMPAQVNAEEGEPNTEVPQDAMTDGALVDSRSDICDIVGEYMPTLKRKLEELSSRVAADLDELETWCRKSKRIKDWSMVRAFREGNSVFAQQVERVDDSSKEVEEILGHCNFQKRLTTHAAGCRKSLPLVTTMLVGKTGEETVERICDYLMEDEIFIIGVYGMGGVGKTAILMHVHNRILEKFAFNDVFWVTVPQEFSICELQGETAHAVGLDNLLKDKDVKRRASMLNRHLKKKRAVLILDGLWMHFDFEDVGIPVEKGGIKLVLTTRSLNLCQEMLCQKQIKIEPLSPIYKDDWNLFVEKLCFGRELPSVLEKIAKSIVKKCGGLPLGIIEIATHMRGVKEVNEWKGMLRKLEESRVELNVFKRLEFSYANLVDSQVQQCFLHLAQVYQISEDFLLDKTELIESFIDEGLLDRIGTRQELYEQGNIILEKLRKGCLCDEDGQHISLHPLIRGMALHIMRSTTHVVKAEMGLKEIPEEEFWTDRLEKVFLQGNDIQEIPYGISPNCPKLMSLSLNNNKFLEAIHKSFFRHMKGLKVLDLSYTRLTKLPNAISHLESLEALLLRECEKLCRVPCVKKLGSLRKLDVSGCKMLRKLPEGMEMLVKLSYLDLHGTMIKTLPEGLRHIKGLKVLDLSYTRLTELPNAISHLESLEVLLLRECEELCRIPCVKKLGSLRNLDVSGCKMLGEVPEGMEMLVKLSYLNLCGTEIKTLPEGLRHIKGLKVLDLSYTRLTELPNAISHLESLEALLLRECEELCHIPCVKKLGSLRELDVSGCKMLGEVPEGMEMLVKLRYLDLWGTGIETLPEGVLGKLVNLQYLVIKKKLRWEEKKLEKVEGLYCSVSNVETFNACVRFLEQNSSRPYELWLNESGDHYFKDKYERRIIIESCDIIAARVDGEIGGDGHALLPKNVQVLKVGWCDGVTSLCDVSPLDNLEKLKIENWEKLEKLGAVHFPHLRRLKITRCSKLKHLLEEGQGLPRLQWFRMEGSEELEEINMEAPLLYSIEVCECPKMKRAVEWKRLATRLPNLRSIKIKNCEKLEEIIGDGPAMPIGATCLLAEFELYGCNNMKGPMLTHDMLLRLPYLQDIRVENCKGIEVIIGTVPDMMHPILPNLICLTLCNLPELKSICDGIVGWILFQRISIRNCPNLKRLPQADNGLPHPQPHLQNIWIDRKTWDLLEYPPPSLRSIWRDQLSFFSQSSLVSFYEYPFNWSNQGRSIIIESCDSIVARVDGEIGGDGYNLLLKNAPVLKVGRGSGVTSLSEVGPLENLEYLTIEGWEKLEELGPVHFPLLRELNIAGCSKLKHLLEEGQGLPCLQSLYIEGSEELEGIKLAAPSLNHMKVSKCPKMKRAVEWEWWLATRLPNLKSIGISDCEKLEEIIGGPLPIGAACLLTVLEITGCNNMKGVLLTHDMLPHLPFLQEIKVKDCKGIEVIMGTVRDMTQPFLPNLIRLTLRDLPELQSIYDGIVSCDSIRYYSILNCPKLKRIPLRLGPLHNGVPSPPPSLRKIWIDRQRWESLEWDHPHARSSLEPFAKFVDSDED